MRILLFSSTYAPRIGGVETVTGRLAAELVKRGHEVLVVTNRYPRSLPARETIDDIPVRRLLFPNVLPGPQSRSLRSRARELALVPLAPLALVRLLRLVRGFGPQATNIHYLSYPAVYMLVVARLLNLPSVLSLHGSDVSSVPFTANYDWALRIACRMAQSVTTCSDYLKTRVLDVVGTEAVGVTAVPNGFDDPSDTDRRPVDAPYVAVVSRLVPKKGIEVALESVRLLLDRGVQVRLVVAGEGPCRADLERRIVELGIGDSVALPGHLEGEDLHGLVRHSLFQLVPSHWESFGVVCLEGMAAGKAIVASRVGGIPDIVRDGETGILVPPSDPVALADAVATLLADPDLARRLGEAGRKRAHEEFTWERMTDRYEEALAHVVRRGTGAAIGARGEETA